MPDQKRHSLRAGFPQTAPSSLLSLADSPVPFAPNNQWPSASTNEVRMSQSDQTTTRASRWDRSRFFSFGSPYCSLGLHCPRCARAQPPHIWAIPPGQLLQRRLVSRASPDLRPFPCTQRYRLARQRSADTIDLNSRGLRDREIPYEKPDGVRRVMVLGDSFVEGDEVSTESVLTRRLEVRLNQPGEQATQAINGGVRAFGTAQEYLFLKNEALRYQPDVVILAFYVGQRSRGQQSTDRSQCLSRHRPYFDLDKSGNLRPLSFRPERPQALGIVGELRRRAPCSSASLTRRGWQAQHGR